LLGVLLEHVYRWAIPPSPKYHILGRLGMALTRDLYRCGLVASQNCGHEVCRKNTTRSRGMSERWIVQDPGWFCWAWVVRLVWLVPVVWRIAPIPKSHFSGDGDGDIGMADVILRIR